MAKNIFLTKICTQKMKILYFEKSGYDSKALVKMKL